MKSALDTVGTHVSVSILIMEHLQDLAACSHGIDDLGLLKSIVVSSATNGWMKDDLHWVSRNEQSNSPGEYRRGNGPQTVACSTYREVQYPQRT